MSLFVALSLLYIYARAISHAEVKPRFYEAGVVIQTLGS